jgi:hypothetical protein
MDLTKEQQDLLAALLGQSVGQISQDKFDDFFKDDLELMKDYQTSIQQLEYDLMNLVRNGSYSGKELIDDIVDISQDISFERKNLGQVQSRVANGKLLLKFLNIKIVAG